MLHDSSATHQETESVTRSVNNISENSVADLAPRVKTQESFIPEWLSGLIQDVLDRPSATVEDHILNQRELMHLISLVPWFLHQK
jgi:hypothetical protein